MKQFWNVLIEQYKDGTVLAAVLRNRRANSTPGDVYRCEPGREIYSLWFGSEKDAHSAVLEVLATNKAKGVAA
jgi:hypothetical protein